MYICNEEGKKNHETVTRVCMRLCRYRRTGEPWDGLRVGFMGCGVVYVQGVIRQVGYVAGCFE